MAATAQVLPDAPSHHFSKRYVAAQLVLEAADASVTYWNASPFWKYDRGKYLQEINPVARPLVRSGTGPLVTYFAAEAGMKIGVAYLLHRTRRHKLEKVWQMASMTSSGFGFTYSFVKGSRWH
jgi:hypothetical protein